MQINQAVKAKPIHPRGGDEKGDGGQAGVVYAMGEKKGTVDVRWDIDGEIEAVKVDQLTALA